ncbi:MAG: hypothetical protein HKN40_12730 [Winogradskyella sp.]|uniref:hypothetical protein n=1 Tax=Winogradskyella sp. TaxID=1883156 RepID=UPI0017EC22D2|nr:hypothetical protein [Winogradskyella sp.]
MTEKKNEKTAWAKFLDFGKGWGLIIAIGTFAVGLGVKMETRMFSNGTMKYETEKLVVESPDAETRQRDRILDSLNKTDAIRSRALRDSLFIEIRKDQIDSREKQRKQDSINLLNADQIFQMKELLNSQ